MTYRFGQIEISPFVEHRFYLDGGSMFGIVPRKIWGRLLPVDENNFMPMSCTLYLIKSEEKLYIIDTGLGDCLSELEQKIYSADNNTHLESELSQLGVAPGQIDGVLLTHLHTDHVGGAVKREGDSLVLRFPNAKYYVQKEEVATALNPDERSRAAYSAERVNALRESGQLIELDGDTEINSQIKAVVTGGHTLGHQGYEFSSEGQTVVNYCDLIPTSHHLKTPYIASTDLYPLQTMKFKSKLVRRIVDENLTLALAHDHQYSLVRVSKENNKFQVTPLESSPVNG